MRARDLLYETGDAIVTNRVRSALTILGIVIGIGAVIAITSLIDGMKMQLVNQLGLNLSRVVNITCWPPGNQQLSMDDADELSQEMAGTYDFVTAYVNTYSQKASSTTASVDGISIMACTPDFFELRGEKTSQGRFFTQDEYDEESQVVVLAGSSVKDLFGSDNAECVGQQVRIGSDQYTVVGTVPNTQGYSNNAIAYMPYTTAKTRVIGANGNGFMNLIGLAREGSDMYAVADYTLSHLQQKYNIPPEDPDNPGGNSNDGYAYVSTAQEQIDRLDQTMGTFRLLSLAVAGISLLVGGIGIMNMMLTNVTERIREIGLRKSLGATSGNITLQFLLESIALCLTGGVFGVAAGYGGAWLLATFAGGALSGLTGTSSSLTPVITPETVAMATAVCVGIGVLFGFYPARRAAKLDPVESLRYQ